MFMLVNKMYAKISNNINKYRSPFIMVKINLTFRQIS